MKVILFIYKILLEAMSLFINPFLVKNLTSDEFAVGSPLSSTLNAFVPCNQQKKLEQCRTEFKPVCNGRHVDAILTGIYPSSFTNIRFWKKIEFLNVIFR